MSTFADPYAPERKTTGDTAKNIWSIWSVISFSSMRKEFYISTRFVSYILIGMLLKMVKKTVFAFF